ncbi:TPA: hypothetical protein DIV49_01460 [Candidatus Saccharibacteria bacterium]|nr:hypothetical protein [Candidatus Saccharibacteria bacterium]
MEKEMATTNRKAKKSSKRKNNWFASIKARLLLVVLLFGAVGVGYMLYQTFAASNRADYWGILTTSNRSATYKLTTGGGAMNVAFSNNTADLSLSVISSSGRTLTTLKSIGKKDVYANLTVVPDTYTISIRMVSGVFAGKKGYSAHITYPTEDSTKPTAVITKPLNSETVSSTVDFMANSYDENGVSKVEFYVGTSLLGTDTSAPYSVKWNTTSVKDGVYQLQVKAYDTTGNIGVASGETTVKNSTAPERRFPGDPNPKVTKKAYWGASGTRMAEHEAATSKSVSIHRTFANAWGKTSQLVTNIKDDHSHNRLPWVSIKTPGWGTLASGSRDAEIDAMLRALDTAADGKPVWLTVHHEFEGDTTTTGEYTAANFRAMQKKIRERMNAVNTKNIAFMPIYVAYSWAKVTRFNPEDWYVAGVWDAIAFDHYSDNANQDPLRESYYNAVNWIEAKGLPFAVGEWGTRDYGDATQAAKEMQDFWNWGFANNKDGIGYSYYDSALNSPEGSWELEGPRLDTWRDILKNDSRVQRINDL